MTEEMRQRLFSSRKVMATLLILVLLGLLLTINAFAQDDKVTVSVQSGEGFVGDRITVNIKLEGITNIAQGNAAGFIEINYDPDLISINRISRGELLRVRDKYDDEFVFLFFENTKVDPPGNKLSATWAPDPTREVDEDKDFYETDEGEKYAIITADGNLISITIDLLAEGTSDFSFVVSTFELYDEALEEIPSEDIIIVDGSITIHGTQLAQVDQPTWNGDVINWVDVANAANYEVKLYNGDEVVDTQIIAPNVQELDFEPRMAEAGAGVYTVTVQALGDDDPWTHGPVSPASEPNIKTESLSQVDQPTWEDDVIKWVDVENAANFEVVLYQDGSPIDTQVVAPGVQEHDFGPRMAEAGAGVYTVTVQALGDGMPYTNGNPSEPSAENIKAAVLSQVSKPSFDEDGNVSWSDVANAVGYKVSLYKDTL